MTLGERIRKLRKENKMTQADLAAKIDVLSANIYKYEKGLITDIPLSKIEALAHALDTTPEYLLGLDRQSEDTCEPLENQVLLLTRHNLYELWHLLGLIEGLIPASGEAGIADDLTFASDKLYTLLSRIDPDPQTEEEK